MWKALSRKEKSKSFRFCFVKISLSLSVISKLSLLAGFVQVMRFSRNGFLPSEKKGKNRLRSVLSDCSDYQVTKWTHQVGKFSYTLKFVFIFHGLFIYLFIVLSYSLFGFCLTDFSHSYLLPDWFGSRVKIFLEVEILRTGVKFFLFFSNGLIRVVLCIFRVRTVVFVTRLRTRKNNFYWKKY